MKLSKKKWILLILAMLLVLIIFYNLFLREKVYQARLDSFIEKISSIDYLEVYQTNPLINSQNKKLRIDANDSIYNGLYKTFNSMSVESIKYSLDIGRSLYNTSMITFYENNAKKSCILIITTNADEEIELEFGGPRTLMYTVLQGSPEWVNKLGY